jgi:hypothetical protein
MGWGKRVITSYPLPHKFLEKEVLQMFVNFEVNNTTYKLRLNTRNVVALEKALGANPLSIFDVQGEMLPSVTAMVTVLHAALQQYNHGVSMNDAYDIFDAYIEDGHTIDEFIYIILDIYKESGLIPKEVETEKN